jgi:hypothetical protein
MITFRPRPSPVKPRVPRLDIGVAYEVLPLDIAESDGRQAFHLRKLNGRPADGILILDTGRQLLCSCRLGWKQQECPHIAALAAAGVLADHGEPVRQRSGIPSARLPRA